MLEMFVLVLVFVLAVVAFFYHQTNHVQINQVNVCLKNLPEEFEDFTIMQITDLHGKSYGRNQAHLIKLMTGNHFDILALTGDIFTDNDVKSSLSLLRHIIQFVHNQDKRIYFVAGNHDLDQAYDHIARTLEEWGVHVLDNRSVAIKRKNAIINIIGIKDALFGMADLDSAVKNVRQGIKILLAHTVFTRGNRSLFQKIQQMKIDLVLSGHTHGFQINLCPLYMTGEGLFPKYVKGLHRIQNSYLYISRGLGTSGIKLRLFSRPELTLIKLVNA